MNQEPPPPSERDLEVFFAALDRSNPAERCEYLDGACAGQPRLRRWVEDEIRKQTGSGAGPDRTVAVSRSSAAEPPLTPEIEAILAACRPEEAGERIGPYLLCEQLGEGGFGIVWKAEQEKPVRRQVALKILKPGMDTKQVVLRFEQERQALAMMDHPGIAKVFDAGATPTGRPFFAMELVRGVPITDYCDGARLPLRTRLELLMRVCYAVQHAHQKGIIHRDLKPSNILVAAQDDGVPLPKVIDLGLAKATLDLHSDHTQLFTRAEQILGTPLYMSPEQADLRGQDVDTRADIYALGVVLYELLTGRTPFDPDEFARRSGQEVLKAIVEEEPPRMSSALRAMADDRIRDVANRRGTDPAILRRTVRGDLEWICLKAMEKDRRRRYAAATNLAADIQHYLLDEPIAARPPSQWYRVRKVVQRNRRGFAGGALIALVILFGGVFGFVQAVRAKSAERRALASEAQESRLRELAEEQRRRAEWERQVARINEYVADTELAQQSLNSGNLGRASQLLEKHRPAANSTDADLRGFGWRYLWQLCRGEAHVPYPNHAGPAAAVAFSPSGDVVAVGGMKTVAVYETGAHSLLATLPAAANSIAFLRGGQTLLTVGGGVVRLWRRDGWTEEASWPDGPGPAVLSGDGSRLALACLDGVRVYDAGTWKEERFLAGAAAPVAFSPDSRSLATDTSSGLTIWPINVGEARVLAGSAGLLAQGETTFLHAARVLAFSPDGLSLVAAQNGVTEQGVFTLGIWNVATGQKSAVMPEDPDRPEHTGAITSLDFAPDGETLATSSLDHSVRLWNFVRRRRTVVLQGHSAEVGAVAFAPDGRTLVSCDRLGGVNAWTVERRKIDDTIPEALRPLGFSPDGRALACLGRDREFVIYDPATKQPERRIALAGANGGSEPRVAVSAGFQTLVQGLDDGRIEVRDLKTGDVRSVQVSDRPVDLVRITPDGRTVFAGSVGQRLSLIDLATGKREELPFAAANLVVSPDGATLAAFSAETEAHPHAGSPSQRPGLDSAGPDAPPGSRLAGAGPSVLFWDLAGHALRATLGGIEDRAILTGAFSPDSRLFATPALGEGIQVWDVQMGELVGTCVGHKQLVTAVAFAYDGLTLASASDDSTLRLWNVATCQELLSFDDLGAGMSGLLFSPDDRVLAVARTAPSRPLGLRFYRAPLLDEIDRR